MWNVKTKVIPVIIEANGTISKSFRKYPSKHTVKARHQGSTKNSHLSTTHTLPEVLT
jgi:effector-binding domain-containing protein